MANSKIKNVLTIGEITAITAEASTNQISLMMENLSISTPILRLMRDLLGRTIQVVSREDETIIDYEKTERLINVKGFNDYMSDLAFIPFGEFCIHERVYDTPEGGSLQLSELVQLPNIYAKFDIANYKSTNGWFYSDKDGNDIAIKDTAFHTSIYGYSIDFPMGYGMFRYGVLQAFEDLNSLEGQIRALQAKYGSVIPVFSYDPVEAETPEGVEALEARVEAIKGLGDNSVLGIPLGGYNSTLKDGFQFISLSDLSIDMHNTMIMRLEDKLETFLMGARFSKSDSGSQAKDKVQSNEKDKMMVHITKIMLSEMQKLLIDDGEMFGYDHREFKFQMSEEQSMEATLDLKKKELLNIELENRNISDKALATTELINTIGLMKANGLDDKIIADTLGVDIKLVTPIKAMEQETSQGAIKEDLTPAGDSGYEKEVPIDGEK